MQRDFTNRQIELLDSMINAEICSVSDDDDTYLEELQSLLDNVNGTKPTEFKKYEIDYYLPSNTTADHIETVVCQAVDMTSALDWFENQPQYKNALIVSLELQRLSAAQLLERLSL